MSSIHTWQLNQPKQIPVSVSLERRNGQVVAFLQKEERRILITTIKGLPENLQGLDGTIARVKEVGGAWRLKVTPLQRAEAGGERSLEVAIKYIQKALQHAMKARSKDVVAVIGNTGTGKSTLINQLLTSCEMVEGNARVYISDKKEWQTKTGRVMPKDPLMEKTEIGHARTISHTLFTKVYSGNELEVADCGGFLETRGGAQAIVVPLSIAYTLRNARSVRLAVCINGPLDSDRCQRFGEVIETLCKKLATADRQRDVLSQIVLIITKASAGYTSQHAVQDIQEIIRELDPQNSYQTYYESIIREGGRYVHVYRPLDEGESCEAIREALDSLRGVQNPRTAFSPPYSRDSLEILNKEVGRIAREIRTLDGEHSTLGVDLERLQRRREDAEESHREFATLIEQKSLLSDERIRQLEKEIKNAEDSQEANREKIKQLKGGLDQPIDQSPLSKEEVKKLLEKLQELSIEDLNRLLAWLGPIQDQEIETFSEGIQIDPQNEQFTREYKTYRVADHSRWGLAMRAVIGGLPSEALLDAIFGQVDKKITEMRPKVQKKIFTYDGVPITRVELTPPKEDACWTNYTLTNLNEEQLSHFSITYKVEGRADAKVTLYTKRRHTAVFKGTLANLEGLVQKREGEIRSLQLQNGELYHDMRTKNKAIGAARDGRLKEKYRQELEGQITRLKEKERRKKEQQEGVVKQIQQLRNGFELIHNFITLSGDATLLQQPEMQRFQTLYQRCFPVSE